MPRPRFARLDPQRRASILDAAAAEFGEQGFERASYNRIIDRAGLSKGAMYYYFDDKADLFATVVADVVGRIDPLLMPAPKVQGPEEFWTQLRSAYQGMLEVVSADTRVSAFMPVLMQLWREPSKPEVLVEYEQRIAVWVADFLARGREIGAVRCDLPDELLQAVVMATGEAVDMWLCKTMSAQGAEPTIDPVSVALGLVRRMLSPDSSG